MMINILVPVYNSGKWLEECLISILNQTSSNYEVIIIDDGSKDNSLEICKKYESKCNMKVYTRENKGVTFTRNELINYATSDYFIFLDSDDILYEKTIEMLSEIIKEKETDAVLYDIKQFSNKYIIKREECIYIEDYSKSKCIKDLLLLDRRGYIAGAMFNKNKWIAIENCFKLEKYIEDWYPVFYYLSNCEIIEYIHAELYMYRQSEVSAISTTGYEVINNYIIARSCIREFVINELDSCIYKEQLDCFMVRTDLDIIHELYNNDVSHFYISVKKLECNNQKLYYVLKNKFLSRQEVIKYILVKFHLFVIAKKIIKL